MAGSSANRGPVAMAAARGAGTKSYRGSSCRACANIHHRQKGCENIRSKEDSASVDRLVGLCHIRPIPQRLMN